MCNLIILKKWAQAKVNKFVQDEKGEVNVVATVVLIGIAVVLAILFKGAIANLLNSLLNTISGNANNALNQI